MKIAVVGAGQGLGKILSQMLGARGHEVWKAGRLFLLPYICH